MVLHLVELLHGQQLQAVDAQRLQVAQLLHQAGVRACMPLLPCALFCRLAGDAAGRRVPSGGWTGSKRPVQRAGPHATMDGSSVAGWRHGCKALAGLLGACTWMPHPAGRVLREAPQMALVHNEVLHGQAQRPVALPGTGWSPPEHCRLLQAGPCRSRAC